MCSESFDNDYESVVDRLQSLNNINYHTLYIYVYIHRNTHVYNTHIRVYIYVCLYITIIQNNAIRYKRYDWTEPKQADSNTRINTLYVYYI